MAYKAIPTNYGGFEMRSRTEARFAQACDTVGIRWDYEPLSFAGRDSSYTPDFKLWVEGSKDSVTVYAEVKPTTELAREWLSNPARMQCVWRNAVKDDDKTAMLLAFYLDDSDRWSYWRKSNNDATTRIYSVSVISERVYALMRLPSPYSTPYSSGRY